MLLSACITIKNTSQGRPYQPCALFSSLPLWRHQHHYRHKTPISNTPHPFMGLYWKSRQKGFLRRTVRVTVSIPTSIRVFSSTHPLRPYTKMKWEHASPIVDQGCVSESCGAMEKHPRIAFLHAVEICRHPNSVFRKVVRNWLQAMQTLPFCRNNRHLKRI